MRFIGWFALIGALMLSACGKTEEQELAELKVATEKAAAEVKPPAQPVGDIEAGKRIAEQCITCHGLDGVAAHSGAPFIAGLEQDYLIRSMLAYSNGSRKHDDMKLITEALKPEDLASVSAYYAALTTPWKGAVLGEESKTLRFDAKAVTAGTKIAPRCNSCHGADGNSQRNDVIPSLAGMPFEYFTSSLKKYFTDERHHGVMKFFSYSLTEQDIDNLAAYYASQAPRQAPRPTKGNAAAGKLAAGPCAGCHGYDGNSLNPHMPNLSGHPADYLIKAIKDYRDGRRSSELMQAPVRGLSDKTITDIAAYYAMQRPESAVQRAKAPAAGFDPLAEGAVIASSCNGCHGEDGNSAKAGVPSLTGLSVKYLVQATKDYQHGARQHKTMQTLVSHFSDTDIEKVAFFYATREPAARHEAVKGDPAQGEQRAAACKMCHGEKGVSHDPHVPSLAGQDAAYLIAATQAYAKGGRANETMKDAAEGVADEDLINIAAYYQAQAAEKPQTFLPENPEFLIEQRCSRCHGERGYSTRAGVPRLAGQMESYLVVAMNEYQEELRKSTTMHAISDVLSLIEIKAVAAYYAKQ